VVPGPGSHGGGRLTGRPPFRAVTLLDTLEQVCGRDPLPPSRLQSKLPRDLETICLKCLSKEADRRYATAADLAEDLRRFLAGEPIRARPVSVLRHALTWARRRPAAATLTALLSVLAVSLLLGAVLWAEADRRRRADDRHRQFVQQRDAALFHGQYVLSQGAVLTGAGLTENRQATETAAREALALAGVAPGSAEAWTPDPSFTDPQRQEVRAGCYLLLLVLADTVAGDADGQRGPRPPRQRLREALALLDQAARTAPPTQTYYLRRAAYLQRLGEETAGGEGRR
jgi:hypothetical protein